MISSHPHPASVAMHTRAPKGVHLFQLSSIASSITWVSFTLEKKSENYTHSWTFDKHRPFYLAPTSMQKQQQQPTQSPNIWLSISSSYQPVICWNFTYTNPNNIWCTPPSYDYLPHCQWLHPSCKTTWPWSGVLACACTRVRNNWL
jgi:hypothetical protein